MHRPHHYQRRAPAGPPGACLDRDSHPADSDVADRARSRDGGPGRGTVVGRIRRADGRRPPGDRLPGGQLPAGVPGGERPHPLPCRRVDLLQVTGGIQMAEITGLRTKFYRSEDGTTWEEIAQIASIQPPQPEREVAEVDELDPPGDVRKKLAGLIDAGEVVVTLNFDPANQGHLDLEQDFRDGAAMHYRIKLPNDFGWTFQ